MYICRVILPRRYTATKYNTDYYESILIWLNCKWIDYFEKQATTSLKFQSSMFKIVINLYNNM